MKKNRTLLLLLPAFLVLVALVLAGCKDFSFYGVLGDRIDDTPLQIAPAAASVAEVSGLLSFSATGGTPPYSYSVIPGTGTGSIVAGTGAFTAGSVGSVTVRVTDSKGRTSNAAITITPTGAVLAISPVNVSINAGGGLTFVASGGTAPYTFSLTASGSGSPAIGAATGAYTAGAVVGADTIEVQDSATPIPATATAIVNVTTATPTVDYSLVPASFVIPSPVTGGTPVAGATFRVQNALVAGGVEDIYWWVYLSDDGTLGSGDTLMDADILGALAAGASADVPFGGTWPLSSGAKSLFIMVSAADDLNAGNNSSAAVAVTLQLPDYSGSLAHTGGTTAGAAFTGTLTIDNVGTADGSQDVSWTVYASLGDTGLGMDDKIVASGDISGGIGLAAAPVVIPFGNTWPSVPGSYFLVAVISAADETNTADNQPSDGPVVVVAAPAPAVDYSGAVSTGTPTRAGGPFSATLTVSNGPVGGSATVYWSVYASLNDTVINAGDKLVGSGSFAGLGASGSSGPLPINSSWPTATGNYYLVAQILADDETAPANNTPSSGVVAVGATDYSGAVAHTGGTTAGAAFTGTLTISNIGGAYALGGSQDLYWNVYASLNDTLISADDKVVGSGVIGGGLAAGANSGALAIGNTWPATAGNYYLIADLFAGDDAVSTNNRPVTAAIAVAAPPAANVNYGGVVVHSTGFTAGAAFTGTVNITNGGSTSGTQNVSWYVYASLGNASIEAGDKLVGSGSIPGGLAASGSTGALAIGSTWPAAAGTYYLVADIQAADDVNLSNNQPASGAVGVAAAPAPAVDYSGTVSTGTPTRAGGSFSATLTVNNGPVGGSATVYWSVYASLNDTVINAGDKLVGSGSFAALAASGSSGPLPISSSWPTATGNYYLVAQILADDETAPANNTPSSAVVAVGATDYSGAVAHTGGTTAGAAFTGTLTISNIGGAYALSGSQDLYWNVYASLGDTLISADDKVVGSGVIGGGLAAGANSGALAIGNTWPATAGNYYLIADLFAGDDAVSTNNRPVTAAIVVAAPPAANVNYGGVVVHSTGTTAGAAFTGTVNITNGGSTNGTLDVNWYVYASLGNATIEAGDKLVGSGSIPGGLGASGSTGALAIGSTWPAAAGTYFLVADIQAADDVNLTNNQPASGAVGVAAAPAPAVDYSGVVSTGTPTRAGGSFSATLTVNNGPVGGSSTVYWSVFASPGDTVINAGDKLVGSGSFAALAASGSSGPLPINSSWPTATGDYYLVAQILADDETAPANNTPFSAVVAVGATDYSGAVAHTGGFTAGAGFTGTLTISNIGGAYALGGSQDLYWNVYASLGDTVISADDKVVGSGVIGGGLGAGVNSGALPIGNTWPAVAGSYYLIADLYAGDDAVSTNNRPVTAAIVVAAPPGANVNYGGVVAHTGGTTAGAAFTGTVNITNGGSTNGTQDVNWYVYASLGNATIEAGDKLVASGSIPGGLAASDSTGVLPFGNTWPPTANNYFLVADIQAADDVNLTNNRPASGVVVVAPAPIPAPDYGGTVSTGIPTRAGGSFNAALTINNASVIGGSSTVYWSVYASLGDTIVDGTDKLVGSGILAALGPSGSSGPLPITSSWPAATGNYYLVAQILADDETASGDNAPFSAVIAVGATDYSGAVAHTGGTTAGAGFTGTLTISNNGGAFALGGSQNLYWNVYASLGDAVISADDKVVGTGMIASGLLAGANSGPLPFGSTWPATAGNYYLIADLFAGDDANSANDQPVSGLVSVGAVDYTGSVTPTTGTTANRPFTGSLTINNVGIRGGVAPYTWTVYASLGNTSIDAADKVVGSATIPAGLPAGGTSGPLAFGGTWPTAPGNYYLVVEVTAADDYLTGNNRFASGAVAVTSPNVDYTALNVTFDPSAPSTTTPGGVVRGTFDYRNAGADAGVQTVFWTAYASRNATLDASDTWIASGIAGPLPGLSTSAAPLSFSGNWPLDYGSYYLLIMVSEIEDVNGANNVVASAATTAIGMFTGPLAENNHEPNNDYAGLLVVYDLGVSMDPGMSLYMEGTMTGPPTVDLDDVIGVKAGTVTTLTASMSWGASQDVALYIWSGPPTLGVKAVSITNATSLAISWPAVPGTQYWIDVTNSASKNIGPYSLIITGN